MTHSPFEIDGDALIWRGDGETLRVESWGTDSVRVRAIVKGEPLDTDYALLPPAPTETEIVVDGDLARLTNGRMTVEFTSIAEHGYQTGYAESRCSLRFVDATGRVLFEELPRGGALHLVPREHRSHLGGDFRVVASFLADPDEKLYGMGQYQQHVLDIKNSTFELAHRNSQVSVPFVMSDRGYGFLWHNPAIGRATFGRNRTEWMAESTKQLDYWVTAGETPADISRAYAAATGHAPMMPEYGLGFWQSKLRYSNQEELLEVAREHVRRGIPLDVIVADFFHWPQMGDFRFEDEFWPDPTAMVDELRGYGIELMVSIWPQISLTSENYAELRRSGFLVRAERGLDVHMSFEGPSAFIDATSPGARARLWEIVAANYGRHGIRLFWLDEAEPEYGVYDFDNYRYAAGTNVQIGNIYPQTLSRAFYEGRRRSGDTEIVNLVRAAWAGSQRYGALVWSGDIHSGWEDFRTQITAGIHMGVAGIPWFTTDIGGFHGGDPADPAFQELLVRWFQFGTFSPVMRLHGDRRSGADVTAADGTRRMPTGGPNELWSFGEEVFPILKEHVLLRERLRPYLSGVMREAHEEGQPVMRGLFHEFPADPRAWDIDDQFLLGPDLLVAPVLEPGARVRRVYLPAGARWVDHATGEVHEGGRDISVAAPLDTIPVFSRGALIEALADR